MAGGKILEIMHKLQFTCPYCIGVAENCINHSIISCPMRKEACNECAVSTDHHGMACQLNAIRVNNRCWRCWLQKSYGHVASHRDGKWGRGCINTSWHGLIKLWAATLWHFRASINRFQIAIDSFIGDAVQSPVKDLVTFVTRVSEYPDVFLQHLEGLL